MNLDQLPDLQSVGLMGALLALASISALRHLATRIVDDLYTLVKKGIRHAISAFTHGIRTLYRREWRHSPDSATPSRSIPNDPAGSENGPSTTSMADQGATAAILKDLVIRTPRGAYDQLEFGHVTALTKTYHARFQGPGQAASQVTIRLAKDAAGTSAIRNEVAILRMLHLDAHQFAKHLPRVIDQFRTADGKPATVFEHLDGLNLQELRQRFVEGIPHRHVIWILRRCLSILGYVHSRGVLHGSLTPERILVRAQDHNVWLTDWCAAINRPSETGQEFRVVDTIYRAPEAHQQRPPGPGSDLYALALCMLYALGGDPSTQTMPSEIPDQLARFLRFLLTDSPLQRPKDAWELYRVVEKIRDEVYGPHQFVVFSVPEAIPRLRKPRYPGIPHD